MRKLISVGAIAVLLAALTTSLYADVSECDILKDKGYTKSLYGLCVAYWSGDADKQNILDKYDARKQDTDPFYLPGTEPPLVDPDPQDPDPIEDICPCWNAESIAEIAYEAGQPVACGTVEFEGTSLSHDMAIFELNEMQFIAGTPVAFPSFAFPAVCHITGFSIPPIEVTAEEEADCRAVLRGLSDVFLDAGIDCGWTE